MTGKENFELDGKSLDFDFKDFWEFQYSNIYNMQETIAEFLVARALGLDDSYNTGYADGTAAFICEAIAGYCSK